MGDDSKTGIALSAGQQVLKLVMDSEARPVGVGNFNYIRVAGGTGIGVEVDRRRIQAPPWPAGRCSSRLSTTAVRAWRSTICPPRTRAVLPHDGVDIEPTSDPAAATTSATPSPASGSLHGERGRSGHLRHRSSRGVEWNGRYFHIEINGVDRTVRSRAEHRRVADVDTFGRPV